jgi:Predicted acetyltransferase
MNGIFEYLLHETNINIDDTKTDEINIAETTNNKFTITRFENGFTLIKVNKMFIPLMEQYINIYRRDLFSDDALSFIIKHFRLNSTHSPYEYIYGITSEKDLLPNTIFDSTIKIDFETLKALSPNKFSKYPFRNPNDKLIYFGTLINGEVVSLASGYLGDFKAIELTGETLTEHRYKGYAKSNTLAITKYLLASGYEVFTTNGVNNKASIQTIKSLGFKRYGCRLAFYEV